MEKIFISHHHSKAPILSKCKKELEKVGFEAFLAHEDIEPGRHDLDAIEEELRNCDIFLYICDKQANESCFCQQEIGFAKGLRKQILTVKTDPAENPPGFIARIQAIYSKDLVSLYDSLFKHLSISEEAEKHLQTIDCNYNGFSLSEKKDFIYLKPNTLWNDYGFCTDFEMLLNNSPLGKIKIGYEGQQQGNHTSANLQSLFHSLSDNFFSRITFMKAYSSEIKENLRYLLNDVTILPKKKLQEIKNKEPVLEDSLFRDAEAEMEALIRSEL